MVHPAEKLAQPSVTSAGTRLGFPRRDLRVAWLAPSLARGWCWQAVFREFTKLFPQTEIFTSVWPGFTPGFEHTFKVRVVRGLRVSRLGAEQTDSAKACTWFSPLLLWHLIRFRPEVILSNGPGGTLYALLVKALLRPRVIVLWQGVPSKTGANVGSLRLAYRRLLAGFLDITLTDTRDGARYLERLLGTPRSRILPFTGEVADGETLRGACNGKETFQHLNRPVFLFVGTPTRSQGVDKLLEACRRLSERGFRSCSLVIVGDGPETRDLQQFARDLRIDRRVHWAGFVPYERLGAYYANCDVFVLPSLEERWGVVVQEAMALGKAVLCSRFAGAREVVDHGSNGFIFDPRNPNELADYMTSFIREPGLTEQFGAASSELSKRHTPEAAAHRLASVLAKALGS
jgi:glycosyltransferase involved in cell wall biosynthesis